MVEGKSEIETVRTIAKKLNCEPEDILNTVRKIKREITEIEKEIEKLKVE